MMKVSILHASRRPHFWEQSARAWLLPALGCPVEYNLIVDADQAHMFGHPPYPVQMIVNTGPRNCVTAYNMAARQATGDVLVDAMDDAFPPWDWCEKFCEAIPDPSKEVVLWTNHGGPRDNDLIVVQIQTRARYQRLGYMLHPQYESMYADDEFTQHAIADGCIVRRPDIVIEHRHPAIVTGIDWDAVYEQENSRGRYERGKAIFERRRAAGFPKEFV